MKAINLSKYLFTFFVLYIISEIINIWHAGISLKGGIFSLIYTFGSYSIYLSFIFVILHSIVTLGKRKTVIFFALALSFGFFSEFFGTLYGWIFGPYFYAPSMRSLLGLMSIETPFSWAVIIYMCYSIANLFLFGFGQKKPRKTNGFSRNFGLIILLSSIAGLCAMNLDMILDLIGASSGAWTWINGGPYFGIPISNFAGWFSVTFFCTFLFRNYELFEEQAVDKPNSIRLYLAIIGIYFVYLFRHVAISLISGHPEFALIGVATMSPFILIALLGLINKDKFIDNKPE